jgi:hypothetical protein
MKNRNTRLMVILPVVACFALLPGAQGQLSTPPDGCYPNFTTAEGCSALNSLTTGAGNTALGWEALLLDTDGSFNTAVGGGALILNDGGSNTAVGTAALLLNTSGFENTAVGTDSLVFNTAASDNNAFGAFALENNDSSGNAFADFNNAFGRNCLLRNVDGAQNDAFGDDAMESNTTGSFNTAMGDDALDECIDGSENVALGDEAGTGIVHGTNIIAIGESVSGVSSVFGEVNDSCYIGNISGAEVDINTAAIVLVDADGKLGTMGVDANGNRTIVPLKGANPPQAVPQRKDPKTEKQASLNLEVEKLQALVAQQQKQIEALTAGLEKVSTQLEMSKPATQVVVNKP